ncbi:LacI family DNA-binding transcriptional regulator [Peribacillus muralis]|uniref:LacI family DNA-binding transcriptional regulator n=1 Tax=Peribacillus muralis TaxID=264697 RepID=UPI001F4EBE80|nr:LacI family DNA-binding transcriptional regulator [Peribacillus muralis]MCK1991050.1 LacI family transcriptional regulator [Peribacillus muralis]MCK2011604.1 LacI family transcriptional regulator [Peribacillus muralis]
MATIKDVVNMTGISRSTVSRVINNDPHVSEEKKIRVLKAMELLKYTPNSAAQSLRNQKTNTIAVLIPELTNPFFAYLLDKIDVAAIEKNLQLLVCQTRYDKRKELQFFELLKTKQVDGIILTSLENDWESISAYTSFGPIVLCNEYSEEAQIPMIHADQLYGSYLGTKHLIEQGYQNIALCCGNDERPSKLGKDRLTGYQKALEEFGLPLCGDWIFQDISNINGKTPFEGGRQLLRKIVSMKNRPDAIFTGSDQVGAGIIFEAKILGVHTPCDIAVMGFDDQEIAATFDLTTIRQPISEMGELTLKRLLDLIDQKEIVQSFDKLPLELVIRNSTKVCPKAKA